MKLITSLILLLCIQTLSAQQYDSVVKEHEHIDSNNSIYKTGTVFVFDYEIILNEEKLKLKVNKSNHGKKEFELAPLDSDSLQVKKIHLLLSHY